MEHTSIYKYRRIELFDKGSLSNYYYDLPEFFCLVEDNLVRSTVSLLEKEAKTNWMLTDPHVIQGATRETLNDNNIAYYCKDIDAVRQELDRYLFQTARSEYRVCDEDYEVEIAKLKTSNPIIFDLKNDKIWWYINGNWLDQDMGIPDNIPWEILGKIGTLAYNPDSGKYYKAIDRSPWLIRWPVQSEIYAEIVNHPNFDSSNPWSILTINCNASSAQYKITGADWVSTNIKMRINNGTYNIEFSDVDQFGTPEPKTVNIQDWISVVATYTSLFKMNFICNIEGAQFRVKDGLWSQFPSNIGMPPDGTWLALPNFISIPAGDYEFEFLASDEYWPLDNKLITVDRYRIIEIEFSLKLFDITVTSNRTGTKARIDSGELKTIPAVFTVKPGTYTITFEDNFGYKTPNPIIVEANSNKTVYGEYTIQNYTLTLNSNLSGSKARIANKISWTDMPTVVTLQESNYTVEFSDMEGYETPESQVITLDTNRTISVTYNPIGKIWTLDIAANITNVSVNIVDNLIWTPLPTSITLPEDTYTLNFLAADPTVTPIAPQVITLDKDTSFTAEFSI